MLIRVGIEALGSGRVLAWGLDFPGCFAYGSDDAEALLRFAGNLLNFGAWIDLHTDEPWFRLENVDFRLVEAYPGGSSPDKNLGDSSTAFFEDDIRPLQQEEIANALAVFRWQREELLAGLEFIPAESLDRKIPGEARTIRGILLDIARTGLRYLNALDTGTPQLPDGLAHLPALEFSQAQINARLPGLKENPAMLEVNGELWSCRKVVRRLLWHQRVQIDAIKRLAG